MNFKSVRDSYPKVWYSWKLNGVKWMIQDLAPEDKEEAVKLLVGNYITDEYLCTVIGFKDDPISVREFSDIWRSLMDQRMSLACYAEMDAIRKLIAVNVCSIHCKGEDIEDGDINGESLRHMMGSAKYIYSKMADGFDYLGTDKVLIGVGLCVAREYRGMGIGTKMLAAREPLCRSIGIKGTCTLFTSVTSQKCAEKCGFTTTLAMPIKCLVDAGFTYPREDYEMVMKIMVNKYEWHCNPV